MTRDESLILKQKLIESMKNSTTGNLAKNNQVIFAGKLN